MKLFWAVVRFVFGLAVLVGGPVLSWEYGFITGTHISPIGWMLFLVIPVPVVIVCWFWQPSVLSWSYDCDKKPARKFII